MKPKVAYEVVLLLITMCLPLLPPTAHSIGLGSIHGNVRAGQTGISLGGATVVASYNGAGTSGVATTDAEGNFTISGLRDGSFLLTTSYPALGSVCYADSQNAVQVFEGYVSNVSIALARTDCPAPAHDPVLPYSDFYAGLGIVGFLALGAGTMVGFILGKRRTHRSEIQT